MHGAPIEKAHAPTPATGVEPRHLTNFDLVEAADAERVRPFDGLDDEQRARLGQYGTPPAVARLMAGLFGPVPRTVSVLDAGAGVGTLTAALIAELLSRPSRPEAIHVVAVEREAAVLPALHQTLARCREQCAFARVECTFEVVPRDFIEYVVRSEADLFGARTRRFECAILNPPYRKIRSSSTHRVLLRQLGIEVSNLYAGFVALTTRVLAPMGQLVAITPRSFCNGPYFDAFRSDLLSRLALTQLHVFDSRAEAFGGDGVLQENVIFHGVAGCPPPATVRTTSSSGLAGDAVTVLDVPYASVVPPGRKHPAIHLITDEIALGVAERMGVFGHRLDDLGLTVSTGRVVDFRARAHLRPDPADDSVPLIYPMHLRDARVRWPVPGGKKCNALARNDETEPLLVPAGTYVLTKRFSAKEQRRRIDAYLYDADVSAGPVGFENHLNYIHAGGRGLDPVLARGLLGFLNSTLVDLYFRLFSGHTQVNATDLRNMPFPDEAGLRRLGARICHFDLDQDALDEAFAEELFTMARRTAGDPVASNKRVQEARAALKALGLPKKQSNVRSALVLLSLLNLEQHMDWRDAENPLMGITEMMDWFAAAYGKHYAPNSRETVRRQTVHQFLDAGLIVQNPDDPGRPVNSGKNVYQIVPEALSVLRTFGSDAWAEALAVYLEQVTTLRETHAQRRKMKRIPVTLDDGTELSLSPGGQNVLVQKVIDEFIPRFAPGSRMLYVGDAEDKWAHFDEAAFAELGLTFDAHGKFPDVVVHYTDKSWLILVEAVTSHGPVDPKRHRELVELFGGASAGLVFVTAFLDRKAFSRSLAEISWETEVWVADAPGHMIHFDGVRFLGPYPESR